MYKAAEAVFTKELFFAHRISKAAKAVQEPNNSDEFKLPGSRGCEQGK